MSSVADRRPLVTPGKIAEIGDADRAIVSGIVRTAAGDLTFEDPVTGSKTLAQLAAGGGGGIGGTTGSTADRLVVATAVLDDVSTVTLTAGAVSTHIADTLKHVPALGSALQVLRVNAGATATEWATSSGGIGGSTGATDNQVLRADGTGGVTLKASPVNIDNAGAVTGVTSLTASGALSASNLSGTNTGDQTITLTGNVTGSGTGSFAATIANDAVTYAKMQNVSAASRIIGRGSAGGSGDPEELTIGSGLSLSGTALSASTTLTGDVTGTGSGSFAATIANDAVTYAKIQNVSAADRLLGRGNGGGSGDVQEITLGTNLSLTGTTLNAASGSVSYTTISPSSIGSNQNNYSPTNWSTADIVRLTASSNYDITGFDASASVVRKLLWNVDTTDTLTLKHESASSTAANRIVCPYDLDMKLSPDGAIVIHYDATTARWRAVSDERRPPMLLSQARRTAGALIAGASFIGFDSEVYTTLGEYLSFDSAGTWTVQKSCTLLLRATMTWQAATSGVGSLVLDFRKNAATVLQEHRSSAEQATDNYTTQTIEVAHDFVASDTIRLYATNFGGSPTTTANMMIMSIFHVKG